MNNHTTNYSLAEKQYTFVLILGLCTPFYLNIANGAMAAANRYGVKLLMDAPSEFSPRQQASLVDHYREQGVDAIIITPCDDKEMVAPLQRAHEQGIKIITVNGCIGNGDYSHGPVTFPLAYIGSDNIRGGIVAAQEVLRLIGGKGKVYIQSTIPGLPDAEQRGQGFQSILANTQGAVSLVDVGYDGGSVDTARKQTAAILQRCPDLNCVLAKGDYSTRGAIQAICEAEKEMQVKVVRFDSSEEAISDLQNGSVDVVIGQKPVEMGRLGVEYALRALTGTSAEVAALPRAVITDFVVINRNNIQSPDTQAVIYRLSV